MSWPDVFTAYHSTGVRNIEAYFEADVTARALYQLGAGIADIVRSEPVRRLLGHRRQCMAGRPVGAAAAGTECVIAAEVEDSWRRRRSARLETPDGYSFTAEAAIAVAQRSRLATSRPGFQTPAKVYGADFVLGFDGVRREELSGPFSDTRSIDMV